jgi:hypothetical protein
MNETIQETPEFEPEQAMPVATVPASVPALVTHQATTPADSRNASVATMLDSAYQQASMLHLTSEEASALAEDFPDEAFSLGAGGDPNLIYIEHAYLRQRLNKVLGVGAAVPIRRREWAEDFSYVDKYGKRCDATRIYADMCLIVRGCLVGESVGEGIYYKKNAKSSYGDALESAMSNAFRRCCKQFGVGLQAWMRGWGDGWKARRASQAQKPAQQTTPPAKVAQKPVSAPAKATPETPEQRKARWIALCVSAGGGKPDYARAVAIELGILLPTEVLTDWPVSKLPETKQAAQEITEAIRKAAGVQEPPPDVSKNETPEVEEPWRSFPVPFGKNAGTPLGKLPKNTLFGFAMNFKVETEYNGRPCKPEKIERDQAFRDALDAASEHYGFQTPEEKATEAEDDVPM